MYRKEHKATSIRRWRKVNLVKYPGRISRASNCQPFIPPFRSPEQRSRHSALEPHRRVLCIHVTATKLLLVIASFDTALLVRVVAVYALIGYNFQIRASEPFARIARVQMDG